jgi:DNA-directed RNA polymerase subunit RPC12/RpoP
MKLKCFDCHYEFNVRAEDLDYEQQVQCPNCHEFILPQDNQTKEQYKGEYNEYSYCRGL